VKISRTVLKTSRYWKLYRLSLTLGHSFLNKNFGLKKSLQEPLKINIIFLNPSSCFFPKQAYKNFFMLFFSANSNKNDFLKDLQNSDHTNINQ